MRGKLRAADLFIGGLRITPACAGKTRREAPYRAPEEDHPRVCGENPIFGAFCSRHRGSPPRVRGKLQMTLSSVLNIRITPACAGKTCFIKTFKNHPQDHPRVCGENGDQEAVRRLHGGSPPRVRGKLLYKDARVDQTRITPACAGKTRRRVVWAVVSEDHPRVCGENTSRVPRHKSGGGSPPRVRGKPRRHAGEP